MKHSFSADLNTAAQEEIPENKKGKPLEKEKNNMKMRRKIVAGLLAATMVFGMNMTTFAASSTVGINQGTYEEKPDAADRAIVKITGITGTPTVTLYQIAEVEYGPGDVEFVDYKWAAGAEFINPENPTANEINAIAQKLTGAVTPAITPITTDTTQNVGDTYSKEVKAGVYIAVITGATDDKIYNPILLTATYNEDGKLYAAEVGSNENYLFGSKAVAKSSMPEVDKEIKDGTTEDSSDPSKETASVGDVVTYEVTPTSPSYPENAINKTFFISDTLSEGLTFDYSSLTVTIAGQNVVRDGYTFKLNDKVIATAAETTNGFNLNFDYDALVYNEDSQAAYAPVVTYKAVINEEAVVGGLGNPNGVIYYYGNPNEGGTWTSVDEKPDSAPGVEKKEDKETVYTYQLAFIKTGEGEDADGLAGAVFGIYKDEGCTKLIDKVTTNEKGYAVSTNVGAGDYWVKELVAPTGYSLNDQKYKITANWSTATTTVTGTVTDRTYTTESPSADAVQVGWIKNGVFYALDEFTKEEAAEGDYQAAYLDSENTTTLPSETTVTENQGAGSGTVMLGNKIPNTKLSTLPGTGGIGTTIFTIGGCAIMIAAAGLYFASRRKENK